MVIKQKSFLRISVLLLTMLLIFNPQVIAENNKVYDHAELFSLVQREGLQQKITELTEKLQLDIVIVTINNNGGKTSRDYADDFYDDHGFGFGEQYDGLLLLINMHDREVYISTSGKAIEHLTDTRIDRVLDQVYPYLSAGTYSEAANAFLSEVERYVQEGVPEGQYTVDEKDVVNQSINQPVNQNGIREVEKVDWASRILSYFFISVAIGAVSVGGMAMFNKGTSSVSRDTYLHRFQITHSENNHYDTRVTKTKIQKNTASSSSLSSTQSTTHTSSSGRTHGGGGRKF